MLDKETKIVKLKDIKPLVKKPRWKKRHLLLKEEILKRYNGSIVVSSDGKILDGNHRYHMLLEEYGPDHRIKIQSDNYTFMAWALLMIMFLPIMVSTLIITYIIILVKKVVKLFF
jgi:hypothetical protein